MSLPGTEYHIEFFKVELYKRFGKLNSKDSR